MHAKILITVLFILGLAQSWAQDEPAPSTPEVPETSEEIISIENLKYQLAPLTADELAEEADAWQRKLKEKAVEIANAKIEAKAAGQNPDGGEVIDQLIIEKHQIADRLSIVLDSWEIKGGDPSQAQAYLTALLGTEIEVNRPSSIMAALKRWWIAEDGAITWAKNIVIFIAVMIGFWIVSALLTGVVKRAMDKHESSSQLLDKFVTKIVRRGTLLIGLIVALSTLGVNVGAMLALIGGGAFIIGFALKDTLSNFASGVMLMIYQPFDVGSAVEIGGVSGSVDAVSLVSTTIRSWDNKIILVPNSKVWGETITNITGADQRRVDMTFGIGYSDDLDKTQEILEKIVAEHELVLADPAPTIKMHELADSSVNFICRPWAKTSDYWTVYWDITKKVKEEFDANAISIPFPQRDVHVHQVG